MVAESLSALMNVLLVHRMKDDSYSIETTNHPLPRTAKKRVTIMMVSLAEKNTLYVKNTLGHL